MKEACFFFFSFLAVTKGIYLVLPYIRMGTHEGLCFGWALAWSSRADPISQASSCHSGHPAQAFAYINYTAEQLS